MQPSVVAVSCSETHSFSKLNQKVIRCIKGFGVEGDAHAGKTVTHRYFVKKDPTRKNIRQVHLIQIELLEELNQAGFSVLPGQLGENITTRGIDLLTLPTGTTLEIGGDVVIEIRALRSPCKQIDHFKDGLMQAVSIKDEDGDLVQKASVMGIVKKGGEIFPGDGITIKFPPEPHRRLKYIW